MARARGPFVISVVRHGVAVSAVLAAFLLRQGLYSTTGIHLGPFFAVFPPVIFAALLLGFWPGISSCAFATVLAYYGMYLPLGSMSGSTSSDRASLGCHAYQGYLFGRPTAPEEIETRLRSQGLFTLPEWWQRARSFPQLKKRRVRCNWLLKRGATQKWGKLAPSFRVAAQIGPYFVLALGDGVATALGLGLACPELPGPIRARNAIHPGSVNRPQWIPGGVDGSA